MHAAVLYPGLDGGKGGWPEGFKAPFQNEQYLLRIGTDRRLQYQHTVLPRQVSDVIATGET
jgi:hypothetical protein